MRTLQEILTSETREFIELTLKPDMDNVTQDSITANSRSNFNPVTNQPIFDPTNNTYDYAFFVYDRKEHTFNAQIDYKKIEIDLMKKIRMSIVRDNQTATKGDGRLTMPRYLSFGQIAEILNVTMIIRVITDDDNEDTQLLGVYDLAEGIYNTNQKILHTAAIQMNDTLTKRDLEELINRLLLICEPASINKNRDLIAVNNGIYNYDTGTLEPFTHSKVFLSKSAVDFNPNATHPNNFTNADGTPWTVEDWLHDIAVDDEVYQLMWETMGAILRPYVKWNKSVWLYSTTGNNGKGTFCELLRNLLGSKAHTSIPISDFAKDFALGPLIGKQAIIVDENDVGTYIDKVGIMKAVITGDIVTINQKFKQPINYRFKGMMIQCLNEYPKVKDKSDSFYRRQIFVPFEKCFTGKENKRIKNEYLCNKQLLEYILLKILTMPKFYDLSEPQVCKDALNNYKESNDPLRQFWLEFEDEFVWDLVPWKFMFDLYKAWYDQNFPKSQQVSYPVFINSLKIIIQRESIVWGCDDDNKKKFRICNKMAKTEMLIHQYNLKEWMSKSYQGRDPKKLCTLKPDDLSASYAGMYRK